MHMRQQLIKILFLFLNEYVLLRCWMINFLNCLDSREREIPQFTFHLILFYVIKSGLEHATHIGRVVVKPQGKRHGIDLK
jgi:hypothetical protein